MSFDRVCVVIEDAEKHPRYINLALAPQGMTAKDAAEVVDKLVCKVKEANPEEYQFEDLIIELEKVGFDIPYIAYAEETW